MNYKMLGTVICSSTILLGGCGILETVEVPEFRFDTNTYVVQPGDTLDSVADRYSIDPSALSAANSLGGSAELVPGQKLLLVRPEQRSIGRGTRVDEPIAMIPAGSQDPQFTSVQDGQAALGTAVPFPPREEFVATGSPAGATDALLDDEPVVAALPTAPGAAVPALRTADVIESDIVVDQSGRPQGAETVIKAVEPGKPNMVEIPAAVNQMVDASKIVKTVPVTGNMSDWNWPAVGTVTRGFDLSEINRQGVDIDPGPGAGVQAAADGEVVYSGRDLASYGNLVILRHKDNYLSAYSKVSDIFVKENQKVKAGDLIAVVGDVAGETTELHFEIRRNGEPVNPADYLPAL